MTRLIHAPGEQRHDDEIYAILDEFALAGLIAGDEIRPKTSDGSVLTLRRAYLSPTQLREILQAAVVQLLRKISDEP